MSAGSSDSLAESSDDQQRCIQETNREAKLVFYANSDFTATSSDQVKKGSYRSRDRSTSQEQ